MNNPKITEEEIVLIKRAKKGDMKAFNALYNKYKYFVESILLQYLNDSDEARDLANIVFIKMRDKLPLFRAYTSFGGWLRIMANNTAIDYLRKKPRTVSFVNDEESNIADNILYSYNEDNIINKITYRNVLKEFDKLPERTRKIFYMFYVDNLTIKQISKRLGTPKGTIKSTLSRTRKYLQTKFKQL